MKTRYYAALFSAIFAVASVVAYRRYCSFWESRTVYTQHYSDEAFKRIVVGQSAESVIESLGMPLEAMVYRGGVVIGEMPGGDYKPEAHDKNATLRYTLGREYKYNRVVRDIWIVENKVQSIQADIVAD